MVVMLLAIVLLFSLVVPLSMAGTTETTSTGSFNLGNSSPMVTALQIYSNSGLTTVVSSMTPQVQYWVKVTIADGNTISDVTSLKLQLFYNAASNGSMTAPSAPGDPEISVLINWTKAGGATAVLDPATGAACTWSIGTPVVPTVLSAANGDWVFPIVVGKVATQTTPVPGVGQWDLYALATDSTSTTGALYTRGKAMYWYGEITVEDALIDFGEVIAGSGFATGVNEVLDVGLLMIANGPFEAKVKSDASWVSSQGVLVATLDATGLTSSPNQFALKTQEGGELDGPGTVLVSSTPQVVCAEPITGEAGHHDDDDAWWLKLSALFTKESYSGAIIYTINNATP